MKRMEISALENFSYEAPKTKDIENKIYENYLDEVKDRIFAPSLSGVYFSRVDIKIISQRMDEDLRVADRKKMIEDLFKLVRSEEDFKNLIEILKGFIDERCNIYKELSEKFPKSSHISDIWIEKGEGAKKVLDRIFREEKERFSIS